MGLLTVPASPASPGGKFLYDTAIHLPIIPGSRLIPRTGLLGVRGVQQDYVAHVLRRKCTVIVGALITNCSWGEEVRDF